LREYELVVVFNPDMEEEALSSSLEKLSGWIDAKGGTVTTQEQWGRKKLSYPIKRFREGIFVLTQYQGGPQLNRELEGNLKFAEEVLRYLLVKKE
jgi:small subunit ribosomal protein S6